MCGEVVEKAGLGVGEVVSASCSTWFRHGARYVRFGCHCCPDDWFAHLACQSVIDKVRVLLQAWRFAVSFVSLLLWLSHALRDALLTYCEEQRWAAACPCG